MRKKAHSDLDHVSYANPDWYAFQALLLPCGVSLRRVAIGSFFVETLFLDFEV